MPLFRVGTGRGMTLPLISSLGSRITALSGRGIPVLLRIWWMGLLYWTRSCARLLGSWLTAIRLPGWICSILLGIAAWTRIALPLLLGSTARISVLIRLIRSVGRMIPGCSVLLCGIPADLLCTQLLCMILVCGFSVACRTEKHGFLSVSVFVFLSEFLHNCPFLIEIRISENLFRI